MTLKDIIKKCKELFSSGNKREKCEKCGLSLSQCKCDDTRDQENRDGCDKNDDDSCKE